MIVTVGGAYRNSGDYLIGDRARALLRRHVDEEIVAVDRKSVTEATYELFNRARAVMLAGGPAYQRGIYPSIYPLDRARVGVPIIPYGLGWKAPIGKTVESFNFNPEALDFITGIHGSIQWSSVRDPLTKDVLAHNGVSNVLMTGCPAWYDLEHFDREFQFVSEPRRVVLSMPAVMQPGVRELMQWLSARFPKAERIVAFHHGIVPARTKRGFQTGRDNFRFALRSMRHGWRIRSLAGSLPKMEELYGSSDLHVGYRVHAHLLCLSRRQSSILINEDARGAGQARALGSESVMVGDGDIAPIQGAVERHFETRGEQVKHSIAAMRATYPTMREFLASI
jgi:hypothetical protein